MDEKLFIENFADALEIESEVLCKDTEFRNLDDWDSLSYLSVIAMLDEEYAIQIEQEDFGKLVTIKDLMEYIDSHK